jgi:[CysO sulfur-carrier protein]-S-L-cysteine hydrolase
MEFRIPDLLLEEIRSHAVECFPHEACGFVVEREGRTEVVRVTNVQNARHGEDPEHFPRTAETAYTMGPEAVPILVGHDRGRLCIVAIYHSHPQHDAYFSAEDRKQATIFDEPSYPDAAQIVVSVYDREVKAVKSFGWSAEKGDFVEIALEIET